MSAMVLGIKDKEVREKNILKNYIIKKSCLNTKSNTDRSKKNDESLASRFIYFFVFYKLVLSVKTNC